jgi:hypothetical protein
MNKPESCINRISNIYDSGLFMVGLDMFIQDCGLFMVGFRQVYTGLLFIHG